MIPQLDISTHNIHNNNNFNTESRAKNDNSHGTAATGLGCILDRPTHGVVAIGCPKKAHRNIPPSTPCGGLVYHKDN